MRNLIVTTVAGLSLFAGALMGTFGAGPQPVAASTFLNCSDDSTLAVHTGHWTHGDPNTGLPAHNGYYYLSIRACSTRLVAHVHLLTPKGEIGKWGLELKHEYDPQNLASAVVVGDATFVYDHAAVGGLYRFRVANLYDETVTDHATITS